MTEHQVPEIHFIGTLVGASGFADNATFCEYWLYTPGNGKDEDDKHTWKHISGNTNGRTQADAPVDETMAVYSQPIDVVYSTNILKGWPKLVVAVSNQDIFGRNSIAGYGFIQLPMAAGTYDLEIQTWKIAGTISEQISNYFLEEAPVLNNPVPTIVSSLDRKDLITISSGKVHVQMSIVTRNIERFGVAS